MGHEEGQAAVTEPPLPPLSFGCEFEFLFAYLPPGVEDPHANVPGAPPVLRVGERGAPSVILEDIRTTLRSKGIPVRYPNDIVPGTANPVSYPLTLPMRLRGLDMWDVTTDASVCEFRMPPYSWHGVELRTPASFAGRDARRSIAYVLDVIKSTYRVRINSSAGFHVHVGNGREWFPPRVLKRVAALLWAADPTLSRLHEPWRRMEFYSNSIRYESELAGGDYDAHAARLAIRRDPHLHDTPRDKMVMSTSSDGDSYRDDSEDEGEKPEPPTRAASNTGRNDGGSFQTSLISIAEEEEPEETTTEEEEGDDTNIHSILRGLFGNPETAANSGNRGNVSAGNTRGARKGAKPKDQKGSGIIPYQGTKLLPHDPKQISRESTRRRVTDHRVTFLSSGYNQSVFWVPTIHNPRKPGVSSTGRKYPVTTTWDGIAEIADCRGKRAGPSVGLLLRGAGHERLNYNFQAYSPFGYSIDFLGKRTIEFREAGGTLDGGWATTWPSICIGLINWCRKCSTFRFLDVLQKLKAQEDRDQRGILHTDDERYDVCDFLEDLGLFAEAEWVRQRERTRGPPR